MKPALPLFTTMVLGLFAALPRLAAGNDAVVTAVFSNVSNGYERQKLPDGSFKREYYALANGQYTRGANTNPSIDNVPFPTIAGLVAGHLARQNYFLAPDSKSADILLVVHWGTTIPFNDTISENSLDHALTSMNGANQALKDAKVSAESTTNSQTDKASTAAIASSAREAMEDGVVEAQAANGMRMKADERNARLLGYSKQINNKDNASRAAGAGTEFNDLISDIEEERYYIVVSAYDFKSATQEGKRKLLWATRVSIRAQGNRFDERLKTMLANASGYFGQESHDLVRRYQSGTVRMDDLKFINSVPEPTDSAKPAEKK